MASYPAQEDPCLLATQPGILVTRSPGSAYGKISTVLGMYGGFL